MVQLAKTLCLIKEKIMNNWTEEEVQSTIEQVGKKAAADSEFRKLCLKKIMNNYIVVISYLFYDSIEMDSGNIMTKV